MLPLDMLILANAPWSDRLIPYLVAIAALGIAGLIGYSNYQNAKAFRIESSSSLEPENVLDTLQSTFARDGWVLGFRDAGSLVMSIDRNASLSSTAALGCFSVWLGLLHLLSSRKHITVEIEVNSSSDGSLIVTNGSRSGPYLTYVAWHLDHLPKVHRDTALS